MSEGEEVEVTRWDAMQLLDREEYEELESLRVAMERGYPLPPMATRRYYQLLGKLKWRKRKKMAELRADVYEWELGNDESRLREFSKGVVVSTRQEAVEYFTRQFKNFKKILSRTDPINWLPKIPPQIEEAAEERVEDTFLGLMEQVEHPEAFDYTKKIWPILIPHASYVKLGIDALDWSFKPYAVATIEIHRVEHEQAFMGWTFKYPSSDRPIVMLTVLFSPEDLNTTTPKLTVPLNLLYGLISGELQPSGCEIVRQEDGGLTYMVEGFESEVTLTEGFINFLTGLKDAPGDPVEKLSELGLLGEMTIRILEAKTMKPPEAPRVGVKDREYLRRIHYVQDYLTYSGWGGVLGLTREGAYRALKRLEGAGLVVLERQESGEGVKVSLTEKGLRAIR